MCKTTRNAAISETQCKHLDEIIKTVWLLLSENVLKAELASLMNFVRPQKAAHQEWL